MDLFVSPEGDDRRSGRRPDPGPWPDGPFRTPARALAELARVRRERPGESVAVWFRGGVYALEEPLAITPAHGGAVGGPRVLLAAYGTETPVLSAGRRVAGWRPAAVRGRAAWVAELPEVRAGRWDFHEFFVADGRRLRPRLPHAEAPLGGPLLRIAGLPDVGPDTPWQQGQDRFAFAPGDLSPAWRNLEDVEVVALHFWVESRLPIAAVDPERHLVVLRRRSVFRLTDDFRPAGARYYLDNVWEALGEPGQWYLDRPAGLLWYLPLPGEAPEATEAYAPFLEQVLRVEGTPERPVENVELRGLAFAHAAWRRPPEGPAGAPQAAVDVPGAVSLVHARGCTLRRCRVAHVGTYAVEVGPGCADTAVLECTLTDLGAGGVKVASGSRRTTVARCAVGPGGLHYHSAVGVLIQDSADNEVVDNRIHHLGYTGVSVGWVWGYGPAQAARNLVARNHIHDIGQGVLSDLGGIYTLGAQPGTVLRRNRIHDVRCAGYGGWGIYLDEGSRDILVEENLVYRTKSGGLHQHYGRDNLVRNNVFAFGEEGQVQRTRLEDHDSFRFERNVVYFDRGPVLHGDWRRPGAAFARNLYWHAGGGALDFGGRSFPAWQALGADADSLVADPRFRDPAAGDFTLSPDSPALRLGFVPYEVGPAAPVGDGRP
jgi:hypothetical protein